MGKTRIDKDETQAELGRWSWEGQVILDAAA
jgi:hypothetical protein